MWKKPEGCNMWVIVTKVQYSFKDGNHMEGIELSLAPSVKKFISFNRDKIELVNLVGNQIHDWYNSADYGDSFALTATLE